MTESQRSLIGGKYELLRELGSGASAVVYLAREVTLEVDAERLVAIKVLREEGGPLAARDRFSQEIRVMAKLVHPNIVPLFETGNWDGRPFLVMPYIEGESLAQRIMRGGKLPVREVLGIARELCDALEYAHSLHIVHRDVKPSNVLITASGHVMLSDFGVARWTELTGDDRPTRSSAGSPGTAAYASPEQLAGERHIDGRSDVYSLGIVLFEALTAELPFRGASAREEMVQRLTGHAGSARERCPAVPPAVDAAIAKALALKLADRWSSAAEFRDALQGDPHPADADESLHDAARASLGSSSTARRVRAGIAAVAAMTVVLTAWVWPVKK